MAEYESTKVAKDFRCFVDNYVEHFHCYGMNGHGERRRFVPKAALKTFWTIENINTVLISPTTRIRQNPEEILKRYLAVFSILVSTSEVENIELFTQNDLEDTQLPLPGCPEVYRESEHKDKFEAFLKSQLEYCPMSFDLETGPKPNRRNLSPHVILPILTKEKINPEADEEHDSAVLYKVQLHPDCSQSTKPVVFKEYRRTEHENEQLYENEWDLYTQLQETSFQHIMRYHGSFECSGRCTIVLEYASGGTLLSFFENVRPPRTNGQRKQFWGNLFGLLEGLQCIDYITRYPEHSYGTWHLRGTHQDIRPQNILVCGDPSEDDYSVSFKFVDLGTAHIRKMRNQGVMRFAVDQFGNGMYSAPEAFRDEDDATSISDKSDIWALGGIASEALMWSIWGEAGRRQYQSERVESTRKTRLKGGYHEGAFHDVEGVLDVVRNWHVRAIEVTGGSAAALSSLILNSMLNANQLERHDAATTFERWMSVVESLETHRSEHVLTNGWPSAVLPVPALVESHKIPVGGGQETPSPLRVRNLTMETIPHGSQPYFPNSPRMMETPHMISSPEETLRRANTTGFGALGIHFDSEGTPSHRSYGNNRSASQKGKSIDGHWYHAIRDNHSSGGKRGPTADQTFSPLHPRREAGSPMDETGGAFLPKYPATHEAKHQISDENLRYQPGSSAFGQLIRGGFSAANAPTMTGAIPSTDHTNWAAIHPETGHISDPAHRAVPKKPKRANSDTITVENIWDKCLSGKGPMSATISRRLGWVSTIEDPLEAFPDLKSCLDMLRGTQGRDQIFVIDDSKSMEIHRNQMAKTCRVLSYLLKIGQVDPNRIFELYFASTSTRITAKNTTQLQNSVETERNKFTSSRCEMRAILDQVVSKVIKDNVPVSIYVLTNGHWNLEEPSSFCGVEKPIRRLIKHIQDNNESENWAIIQFIRFYKSAESNWEDDCGRGRMKHLDNNLKDRLQFPLDIVDTVDANKDVRKILLGAFSEEWDWDSESE